MVLHGGEASETELVFVAADNEGLALFCVVVLLADGTVDVYLAPHERGLAFEGVISLALGGDARTHRVYILIKEKERCGR